MGECENEAPPLNLAMLLEQAQKPKGPVASKDSTLLALHAAQSSSLKKTQAELEAERADHRRTLETLSAREVELATKTAELDGVREALAETNRLRTELQTKEGECASAQAAAEERSKQLKELKKQQKSQQAAFLALANVNSQSYTAFMRDDSSDDD